MSEPHYRCVVTGELLPESKMVEVPVDQLQTKGHDYFKRELVGTPRVSDDIYGLAGYVSIALLTAFGEIVMVYKEDMEYGRCHDPSDLSSTEMEQWNVVVEAARSEE